MAVYEVGVKHILGLFYITRNEEAVLEDFKIVDMSAKGRGIVPVGICLLPTAGKMLFIITANTLDAKIAEHMYVILHVAFDEAVALGT